ncbi:LacI family DNA-binding transcriptional regulator [Fictibacillus terranigra]|uniref:LacI family DNA-binding transcriptional regulator n=1 Tax=Fictibacillus terranigra TaxID=3058424 RepID=A0ABT8E1C8_9BACL|nr:LacI family DNA-binding transcriptional regulator [Fictibacillus sp. CENA-BCM004]MDN4071718.1 LacI family DNA-binding transcriptional regulator [Fictibacillus sp. CENA-BCM004]
MATIKDVAKQAGVSVATVSRVLNSNGYVNEDTKKKVEEAIDRLNYKPNAVARSLYKKTSKTIGLMVPDIVNPFFPELARAVEDTAHKLGYNVVFCNTDENVEKEEHYLEILLQKYVDGLIVASNTLTAEKVRQLNIPVVSIDRKINADIPTVVVKNKSGARKATGFLLEMGCKRIAHLSGPEHIDNAMERRTGYLEEVGSEPWFDSSYIEDGNYDMKTAINATLQLLGRHPEIDGIFAGNDVMAIGAIKAAHKFGKKVPEDLAIIGFDGISLAEATTPELTTVGQPIYDMGTIVADLLVKLIEKKAVENTFFEFDVELIERESTRKV